MSTKVFSEQDSKEEITNSPQENATPIKTDNIMPVESSIDKIVAVKVAESEAATKLESSSESVNVQEVENAISSLKMGDKEVKEVDYVAVTTLDRDQSNEYLASVFIDALQR